MNKMLAGATLAVLMLSSGFSLVHANSRWGVDYFPNPSLTTHNGDKVRFFDDLIKDKIVVINFIYTSCVDTCPLETAQLTKVQEILGDRLGRDVFFYSISIDPEHDTPEVLKEYADRFHARWTFLTGDERDIIQLRSKLGLYIEEIQDGSNNHNVNMIIGNQATGQWRRRSPFENPYILAEQIGNWLTGWKAAPQGDNYANAPKLRPLTRGEQLFRTRCVSCHSIDGRESDQAVGPDLLGVTQLRDRQWLVNWLKAPDAMLAKRDPIAMMLFEKYGKLPMPNMRLNRVDVMALLDYLDTESRRVQRPPNGTHAAVTADLAKSVATAVDVVAVANAWIREADTGAKAHAGYLTLVNIGNTDVTLVGATSADFGKVEVHEMAMKDGIMKMRKATPLVIPAGGKLILAPGGKHLMLMGKQKPVLQGRNFDVDFLFDDEKTQTVTFVVTRQTL